MIQSLFLELDAETHSLAATTARLLYLASTEKKETDLHLIPMLPLPLVILPRLVDIFLGGEEKEAVEQLLDWFADWTSLSDPADKVSFASQNADTRI